MDVCGISSTRNRLIGLGPFSPDRTRITANIRYVLTRKQQLQAPGMLVPQLATDSVAFSSNEVATISPSAANELHCTATGKMKGDILAALR